MSSKRDNESFLQGGGDEETHCLLHTFTDVKEESVSLEETKKLYKDKKLENRGQQNKETFDREKYQEAAEAIVIVVDETTDSNKIVVVTEKHQDKRTQEFKKQDVTRFMEEEIEVEDEETTSEKFPSLAEPEESENEGDSEPNDIKNEGLLLYENFVNEACEKCFKILEDNAEQLTKLSCAEKTCTLEDSSLKKTDTFDEKTTVKENDKACKSMHDIDLDSSGSFRASIHSLSTCHESLPSSRGCPTKRDLYLDLECRICHDTEGQDLISPCHCAGTSKWVHESCIIKWIRHTKTKQCEICTCPITVKRKKKPIEQVRKIHLKVLRYSQRVLCSGFGNRPCFVCRER